MSSRSIEARYANYLEVGHNAFEFLLDFGQLYGEEPPAIHTRIVTGPVYARAMLRTITQAIEQYEKAFGSIPEQG